MAADYKDYIVRYNITANPGEAVTGLQELAKLAQTALQPLEQVSAAIKQIAQSARVLKNSANTKFTPTIDTSTFLGQLRSMTTAVEEEAAKMQRAIYSALTNTPKGAQAVQKGAKAGLNSTKSLKELKGDLAAYQKELDKLLGTPKGTNRKGEKIRNRDGSILMAKNAGLTERVAELEHRKKMFQNAISKTKADIAALEKLEKEATAQDKKLGSKSQAMVTKAPSAKTATPTSALTNLTPAVIREWKKAFGDNIKPKNLTVNVTGNAASTIAALNESLAALTAPKNIVVNATLGEGFTAAERRIQALAALQNNLTGKVGANDKKKTPNNIPTRTIPTNLTNGKRLALTNAYRAADQLKAQIESGAIKDQETLKVLNDKLNKRNETISKYGGTPVTLASASPKATPIKQASTQPYVIDVIGNLTGIKSPKTFVTPVIGELTALQGKVSEAIPVNVKIMPDQVAQSLRSIPAPQRTMDVIVRISGENVSQQLKAISEKVQPTTVKKGASTKGTAVQPSNATAPRPVYTPPVFTATDEQKLNGLYSKLGNVSPKLNKAVKDATLAKNALGRRNAGSAAYENYEKKIAIAKDLQQQHDQIMQSAKPLMFKQFQSTAQRPLSDSELAKGILAQRTVDELSQKKRLTATQKTQLTEANNTLAALRAPATQPAPAPATTPTSTTTPAPAVVKEQPKTIKSAKTPKSSVAITGAVDTNDIVKQIKAIPRQTIPVSVKLMWEKGAVGRQAQIKELTSKIPSIPLTLETSGAIAKLEEFITLVKAASPQNIALTATGAATGATTPVKQSTVTKQKGNAKTTAQSVAATKPEQSKPKTPKQSPLALTLDTSAATTALEAFIAKIKAASPQNIKLTASGNLNGQAKAAGSGKGKVATGAIPTNVKEYRDNLGKHLSKPLTLPSNYATQIADQQRTRAWHLDQMRRDAMAAFFQKTPYELAEEERLRKLMPTSAGSGKGKVVWGNQAPAANTAPKGYKWTANNNLTSYLSPEQKQQLGVLQAAESKAAQNVRDIQSRIAASTNRSNTRLSTAQASYNTLEQQLAPWRHQMNQLEEMKKPLLSLKKLNATQKKALANITAAQVPIAAQIEQLSNQQAPFAAAIQHENALMARYQSMSNRALSGARQQHSQAVSAVNRYTTGWSLTENNPKGVASPWNMQKAQQLQAQFHNSMLPFGLNKSQMDVVKQYRQFFKMGATASGITPMAGMQAQQMMQYLQAVSTQMQASNVAVPVQLQSYMNNLEKQMAKTSSGSAGRGAAVAPYATRQKPFFDRARKWAYPFTGQTSFGARTPMAVDMAKGMGVMFAIGGAMSAIGGSFSQAMEYQNMMETTKAILQNGTDSYTESGFRGMQETVRNVGVKTKFSAPEVASAAKFLAMAGMDINTINNAIRPIADLALIGDQDLGEVADKMTNIMTTFGITSEELKRNPNKMREFANIMTTVSTRSNTDLMMLAESAKYGGGVANMYGRKDPNLFADTMAIFGVMGNAGIQASSAGTSLRMMYQNIFNPNKKQKAILDMLEDKYQIRTKDEKGEKRSMADIIIDLANKVDEDMLPDIVGKLFRITAQPGANAALLSASDIAVQESGGDANAAVRLMDETNAFVDKIGGKDSKKQLSALASLISAARNSVGGHISEDVSEKKQNTLSGLWAQVTSMFTEGIVQAMEERQGGFAGMLIAIRDYFAKPETVQMLKNLLDLIIEIGKVMAGFVKIWANLYNFAPGLVKLWVTTQMLFTQMGALIAPFVSLIGVFNRLGGIITRLTGVSLLGGAAVAGTATGSAARMAGAASNAALMGTPFIVGQTKKGKDIVIKGNAAVRANQAIAANASRITMGEALMGASMMSGSRRLPQSFNASSIVGVDRQAFADRQNKIAAANEKTRQHYAEVRNRAQRIYGGRARIARSFMSGFSAIPTAASFAPLFGGIKSMFMGLLTSLAKGIGFLVNPITLTVGAAAALGWGIYKLKQHMDGATEAQQQSRKQANKAADQTTRELTKEGQWYKDMMSQDIPAPAEVISSINTEQIAQFNADKEKFNQMYATIFNDFSKDASKQSVNDVATKWRDVITSNPQYRLAIGNSNVYDFTKKHKQLDLNPYNDAANGGIALWNLWHADEDRAINQRMGMVQEALMIEGANSAVAQNAVRQITELRKKYLNGAINPDTQKAYTESEYTAKVQEIKKNVINSFTTHLSADNMTPEQLKGISNRSVFMPYQTGVANLLDATINGELGTMVGKMDAYKWLSDAKNKALSYTDEWYKNIAHIISDYHVIYNAVSADGKQNANVELILSTLPTGKLDFTNILDQIRSKISNFQMTLQGFTDIIGTAYKMMAEAGVIDITSKDDLKKQIRTQMAGAKYTAKSYEDYYAQFIANNSNSEWIKAGIGQQQYVDFMMGKSGETIKTANRVVSLNAEKQQMYWNLANKTATQIYDQYKGVTDKAKELSGGNTTDGTTSTSTPTTPQQPSAPQDQTAYASSYEKAASRPTHINININELAHFDRTTVASSAEERDLIAMMESRITDALYQVFAQAANQAQNVIDLT